MSNAEELVDLVEASTDEVAADAPDLEKEAPVDEGDGVGGDVPEEPDVDPEKDPDPEDPKVETDPGESRADDPFAFLEADLGSGESEPKADTASEYLTSAMDALKAEKEQLAAQLAEARQNIINSTDVSPPDVGLINPQSENYSPDDYNEQMFKYQQHQAAKLQAEQQQQIDDQAKAEKFVQERDAQLQKSMPFLFEGEKGKKAAEAIAKEAVKSGLPEEQVWAMTAPMVETFYNSLQWKAAKAGRKAAEQKATEKESPKPLKVNSGRGPAADPLVELYDANR